MPQHPTVVVEHPMASKTEAEISNMAQRFLGAIAGALVKKP
jgi:hypothetical protein